MCYINLLVILTLTVDIEVDCCADEAGIHATSVSVSISCSYSSVCSLPYQNDGLPGEQHLACLYCSVHTVCVCYMFY